MADVTGRQSDKIAGKAPGKTPGAGSRQHDRSFDGDHPVKTASRYRAGTRSAKMVNQT
jgi:hypothetical protein